MSPVLIKQGGVTYETQIIHEAYNNEIIFQVFEGAIYFRRISIFQEKRLLLRAL